ncbi:MAG: hypothetical protein J6Y86_11880 [Pseudobutyrivibrio sp.]|nr:hypothetical protein [Pseudobutyrivibrio sp.]
MHGKCSMCGKLFHIEDDFVLDFEKSVKKIYGFQVDLGKTLIVGVCSECM